MNPENSETRFFIALLLVAAALAVFVFLPYLNAIVLGVVLAVLFHPVYSGLLKIVPSWRGLASFITVLVTIAVILAPLIFFGLQVFQEAQDLYAQFAAGRSSQIVEFVRMEIVKLAPWFNLDLSQYAKQALGFVVSNIGPVFSQATGIAVTFFFGFFVLYYLLKDGQKLNSAIVRMSPLPREDTERVLSKLGRMARSVIKGSLVVAVLQGLFVGLGFFLFGLSGAVLWGSVAVVAALIPFVGVALVVLPAALSLALAGNLGGAIGFIVFTFLAAGLIDNFLRPRLIDHDTNAHPLLVLLSVLGGIATFGPMGFLLGPLALTLFLTLLEIYPLLVQKGR